MDAKSDKVRSVRSTDAKENGGVKTAKELPESRGSTASMTSRADKTEEESQELNASKETLVPLVVALAPAAATLALGEAAAALAADALVLAVAGYFLYTMSESLWRSAEDSARARAAVASSSRASSASDGLSDSGDSSNASSSGSSSSGSSAHTFFPGATFGASLFYLTMPALGGTALYLARAHLARGTHIVSNFNIGLYMVLELVKNIRRLDSLKRPDGNYALSARLPPLALEAELRQLRRENRIARVNMAALAQRINETAVFAAEERQLLRSELRTVTERLRKCEALATKLPSPMSESVPVHKPVVTAPVSRPRKTLWLETVREEEDVDVQARETPLYAQKVPVGRTKSDPAGTIPPRRVSSGHKPIPTASTRLPRSSSRLMLSLRLTEFTMRLSWLLMTLPARVLRRLFASHTD